MRGVYERVYGRRIWEEHVKGVERGVYECIFLFRGLYERVHEKSV